MTESPRRSLAKALSWQMLGLVSMSLLGYLFTGSFSAGGTLALVSCAIGFVTYILHERLWAGIRWGAAANADPRTLPNQG